jgi:hypothetical protein
VDDNGGCDLESVDPLVGSQIDVQAYFADEKLLRDTCITSGQPESVDGPCGGTAGGTTTITSGTTSSTRAPRKRASRFSLTGRSNTLG